MASEVKASDLTQRVQIQRSIESAVSGGGGEPIPTWYNEPGGLVWAAIATNGSRELYYASQVYPQATHVVAIRHRGGLTAKKRLKWGDRVLNIIGIVDPTQKRRTLNLYCVEAVATET